MTLGELSYNNTLSTTTGMTPFRAIYGINLRYMVNLKLDTKIPTPAVIQEYANILAELDAYLHSKMRWAQATHSKQVEKHQILAPGLEVGNQV